MLSRSYLPTHWGQVYSVDSHVMYTMRPHNGIWEIWVVTPPVGMRHTPQNQHICPSIYPGGSARIIEPRLGRHRPTSSHNRLSEGAKYVIRIGNI